MDFSGLNEACITAFGSNVTHDPVTGSDQTITAIVQDPSRLDDATPGVLMVASASAADFLTAPAKNDHIVIGSSTYRVFEVSVDGGGMVHLSLTQ